MILTKLSVINYRNIAEATIELSPKINCFIGRNGVGKTNILDAVYYLSFCRSSLNSIDSQNIRHGEDFFMIEGNYADEGGEPENIYCGMKRGAKKRFKRNGKEYKRLSEHIGLVPVVLVSPRDTMIIDGQSEERRRLMDMVIAQYDHTYVESLSRYSKALQQRNTLLKEEQEPDVALMEVLEEQMAEEGELLFSRRSSFIERLVPVFCHYYQLISDGREAVNIEYKSHCQHGKLLDIIRGGRDKDRIVGFSLHGVHRDELEFSIGGNAVKREASQGQNKTFAIALKLAQFDFLKETSSRTTPILLLDDIFDKLDAERVEKIVGIVADKGFGQIFVTDTNRSHLDSILESTSGDYKLFDVEEMLKR